jgi:hypothetical protein
MVEIFVKELECFLSSKNNSKENYTSKSFKENRDQDEPVYRPKVWDHKHVPYSSHNKLLIIGFIIIAAVHHRRGYISYVISTLTIPEIYEVCCYTSSSNDDESDD